MDLPDVFSYYEYPLQTLHICKLCIYYNLSVFSLSSVSDLQEEGKNAINAPMNPSAVDIHPEDTLLGKVFKLQTSTKQLLMKVATVTPISTALLFNVDCSVETERAGHEN